MISRACGNPVDEGSHSILGLQPHKAAVYKCLNRDFTHTQ